MDGQSAPKRHNTIAQNKVVSRDRDVDGRKVSEFSSSTTNPLGDGANVGSVCVPVGAFVIWSLESETVSCTVLFDTGAIGGFVATDL